MGTDGDDCADPQTSQSEDDLTSRTNYSIPILQDAADIAKDMVELQTEWLIQTQRDFSRLLRLNFIILGVVVSLLGYGAILEVSQPANSINPFIVIGAIFWIISTITLVSAYTGIGAFVGAEGLIHRSDFIEKLDETAPGPWELTDVDLQDAIDGTNEDYYRTKLNQYQETADNNLGEAMFRLPLYYGAVWLLVATVLMLYWIRAQNLRVNQGSFDVFRH